MPGGIRPLGWITRFRLALFLAVSRPLAPAQYCHWQSSAWFSRAPTAQIRPMNTFTMQYATLPESQTRLCSLFISPDVAVPFRRRLHRHVQLVFKVESISECPSVHPGGLVVINGLRAVARLVADRRTRRRTSQMAIVSHIVALWSFVLVPLYWPSKANMTS